MEKMMNFFRNDKFSGHVGIELIEVSEGRAKAKMKINEHHLNSMGTVHGAALFALADLVFAVASNSHGTIAMAINAHISYIKAARKGFLWAEGKEMSLNPKLATYTIHIRDDNNDLIAIFQGMVFRKTS
ncbi:MAG TPA: phenylacetic acid degradation protein [Firmicutes bacterium]|jgi:acyl-CoA thioesterase|nr:PaaI family thioesterase [Bacillota bacterium]HAA33734.1 phenylacetic acid degradation protein [Bacillota bacterium]